MADTNHRGKGAYTPKQKRPKVSRRHLRLLELTERKEPYFDPAEESLYVHLHLVSKPKIGPRNEVGHCPKSKSQGNPYSPAAIKRPLAGCYYSNGSMNGKVLMANSVSVKVQYPGIGTPKTHTFQTHAFLQYLQQNRMKIFFTRGLSVYVAQALWMLDKPPKFCRIPYQKDDDYSQQE